MKRFILSYLGYVKVPLAAVMLSISHENIMKDIINKIEDEETKGQYEVILLSIKTMTEFLRSGRL